MYSIFDILCLVGLILDGLFLILRKDKPVDGTTVCFSVFAIISAMALLN